MDNLTHTLFAFTLARTPLGRAGRGATAALVVASNVPDVDAVTLARGSLEYMRWHRGPTHGPLGVVGLGVITAALVWGWERWRGTSGRGGGATDEPPASFGALVAIAMAGVLLHILMDLPTSYGIRLLSPFDWTWYAFDWLPIVDVLLLTVLVTGLVSGRVRPDATRRVTALALALMAANYGLRATAHHQAVSKTPALYGSVLPPRCTGPGAAVVTSALERWPRGEVVMPEPGSRPCLVEIAAVPTFLSPFRWRVITQLSNAYEVHEVDLLGGLTGDQSDRDRFFRMSIRYPNQWIAAVRHAATTAPAQAFLGFSRFPAARAAVDKEGVALVRWSDMRFVGGIVTLTSPRGPGSRFTLLVRTGKDGGLIDARTGQ